MARPFSIIPIRYFLQLILGAAFAFSPLTGVMASETVQPKPYQQTQLLTGFTEARQTINVSSEVGGKCLAVQVEIGGTVPQSGVLAELDVTFISLDIQANKLEAESIERQLQTEKKTLARYTTLIDKNSATKAKLDEVTLNVDLHEMKLKTLHNQYLRLQQNLDRHTITAPKGWTLIKRMIEPGEYIQPGQVVATIGDFSQLVIRFALSYTNLQNLQQSETIPLYFPDLGLKTTGKMYRVSPGFSESTKKIPVDVIIDNKDGFSIRGGLRGELRLKLQNRGSFLLPISAIINRYDAHWVVKENNEKIRVVFLGTTDEGTSAIISSSDLSLTDKVLKEIPEGF